MQQAPCFFGYGSLVNRRTHAHDPAWRAEARGWRRTWCATDLRQMAYLTAVPDPDCTILGLTAEVAGADWAALDAREDAYDRLPASHQVTHDGPPRDIAIYAVPETRRGPPRDDQPILLSYLDVVVQGYLVEFGTEGAAHFFDTTSGWETPVLDDRAAPRYPRAQTLTDDQRAVVDQALVRFGTRLIRDQGVVR